MKGVWVCWLRYFNFFNLNLVFFNLSRFYFWLKFDLLFNNRRFVEWDWGSHILCVIIIFKGCGSAEFPTILDIWTESATTRIDNDLTFNDLWLFLWSGNFSVPHEQFIIKIVLILTLHCVPPRWSRCLPAVLFLRYIRLTDRFLYFTLDYPLCSQIFLCLCLLYRLLYDLCLFFLQHGLQLFPLFDTFSLLLNSLLPLLFQQLLQPI